MKICLLSHDNKGSLPRFPVEGGVFFTQFRAIKSSLDISIVKGFCLIERDIFLRGVMIDNRGSQGNLFLFKLSLSQLSLPFSFSLSLFLLHPYLKQVFISLFFFLNVRKLYHYNDWPCVQRLILISNQQLVQEGYLKENEPFVVKRCCYVKAWRTRWLYFSSEFSYCKSVKLS